MRLLRSWRWSSGAYGDDWGKSGVLSCFLFRELYLGCSRLSRGRKREKGVARSRMRCDVCVCLVVEREREREKRRRCAARVLRARSQTRVLRSPRFAARRARKNNTRRARAPPSFSLVAAAVPLSLSPSLTERLLLARAGASHTHTTFCARASTTPKDRRRRFLCLFPCLSCSPPFSPPAPNPFFEQEPAFEAALPRLVDQCDALGLCLRAGSRAEALTTCGCQRTERERGAP